MTWARIRRLAPEPMPRKPPVPQPIKGLQLTPSGNALILILTMKSQDPVLTIPMLPAFTRKHLHFLSQAVIKAAKSTLILVRPITIRMASTILVKSPDQHFPWAGDIKARKTTGVLDRAHIFRTRIRQQKVAQLGAWVTG